MKNIITFLTLLFCIGSAKGQTIDTLEFASWINKNSIKIEQSNYPKLLKKLKDKTVIGLGECVHGSKTINNLRIQIAKLLINRTDFRNVAFEMSFNTGLKINHFIQTGEGDLNKILKESHFFLNSSELFEFILWAKDFNKNADKKINFYGFDIQSNIDLVESLLLYYEKTDKEALDLSQNLLKIFFKNKMNSFRKYPHTLKDSVTNIIDLLSRKHILNKKKFILKNGYINFEYNKKRIEVLSNSLRMLNGNYGEYLKIRDSCNADLIKWIKDFEGENSKIILFAHNGHLGFGNIYVPRVRTLSTEGFYQDLPKELSTGYYLKEIFKESYYFIGTQFSNGYFMGFNPENDYKLSKLEVTSPEKYTLPYLFQQAGTSPYFIDFKFSKNTPRQVVNYICSLQNFYDIGAAYGSKYAKTRLVDYFNAIMYVDKIKESDLFK